MYVRCPRCGAYAAGATGEEARVRCAFCGSRFQPTAGQVAHSRQAERVENFRRRLMPLDLAGSLVLVGVTVFLLLRMRAVGAPHEVMESAAFWGFAGWTAVLAASAWGLYRSGAREELPSLFRTLLVLLGALAAPVLLRLF